jgi:CMP-N,N'-diacetyllegionaminic acid synthase
VKIVGVIPARGGSKGLPGKNIKNFCGMPLIAYTILAAQDAGIFDRVVVSTDTSEIADVAKAYGAEVPYLRLKKLATNSANIVDAILHLLDYWRTEEAYEAELLFLLQPTSPLRDAQDILASYECFKRAKAPALVSVVKTLHQTFRIVDGRLKLLGGHKSAHVNRQELPDTFKQDGSIYIVDVSFFRTKKTFMPPTRTAAYVVPKWKAVDIDDYEDFRIAEVLYANRALLQKR